MGLQIPFMKSSVRCGSSTLYKSFELLCHTGSLSSVAEPSSASTTASTVEKETDQDDNGSQHGGGLIPRLHGEHASRKKAVRTEPPPTRVLLGRRRRGHHPRILPSHETIPHRHPQPHQTDIYLSLQRRDKAPRRRKANIAIMANPSIRSRADRRWGNPPHP